MVMIAETELKKLLQGKKVAIVGIGNRLRGDDAIGSVIAQRLSEGVVSAATVIDAETVPENYLDDLRKAKPDVVLFVDAVDFGGEVGDWKLVPLQALADKLPSTHTMSVKLLGQLLEGEGMTCWLLAIQPKQIALGIPMSEKLAEAANRIVDLLVLELNEAGGER